MQMRSFARKNGVLRMTMDMLRIEEGLLTSQTPFEMTEVVQRAWELGVGRDGKVVCGEKG
jgi:hypothetical protein